MQHSFIVLCFNIQLFDILQFSVVCGVHGLKNFLLKYDRIALSM